jgi:hypothetical protein
MTFLYFCLFVCWFMLGWIYPSLWRSAIKKELNNCFSSIATIFMGFQFKAFISFAHYLQMMPKDENRWHENLNWKHFLFCLKPRFCFVSKIFMLFWCMFFIDVLLYKYCNAQCIRYIIKLNWGDYIQLMTDNLLLKLSV